MVKRLWFSYFTFSITKGAVQRVRPYVYNPGVPVDKKLITDARKSFISGHTTMAFASMTFLSTVFMEYNPNSKYIPVVLGGGLLTAAAVGVLRVESGNHFPSDVIGRSYCRNCYRIPYSIHSPGQ